MGECIKMSRDEQMYGQMDERMDVRLTTLHNETMYGRMEDWTVGLLERRKKEWINGLTDEKTSGCTGERMYV